MRRLSTLILLLVTIHCSARAQQFETHRPESERARAARLDTRPPALLPIETDFDRRIWSRDEEGASISTGELLTRIGRIYERQARLLEAEATGNHELASEMLDAALLELQGLINYEEAVELPRFQNLYRTVLTEYERYYGVPADSLSMPYGDIFSIRDDMFAAMNEVDEPLLENVLFPQFGPVATTIEMTQNRLVQQSIDYLLRSPERHLYNWLGRAETYFPMIEKVLQDEGVPDELKYLAMIESGLNPRARSWASANGMWQFISATGRAYGLQVNSWVDERLDPEKSTRAAARHLLDLYDLFGGDWQLALAGYNCSPSRIKRALRRAESRLGRKATFWDIYNDIPRETRNYVPMFIATALVASNPEAFDVDVSRVEAGPEYEFHYVPVRGFLTLDDIAEMAGTSDDVIRALNPELRRSIIPPSKNGYYLRIPLNTYDRFAEAYSELPPEKRQSAVTYVVRRGDVLGKIARQYGVSVTELMQTNGLRSTTIRVGQELVVPVPSYDSSPLLADLSGAEVITVDYGRTQIRPIVVGGAIADRSVGSRKSATPIVRTSTSGPRSSRSTELADRRTSESNPVPREDAGRGEDARERDESIESERGARVATGAGTSSRNPEPSESEEAAPEEAETRIVYTVRRGDNLTNIARKYGVTLADLRKWNGISGSRIQAGQRLYLYDGNPDAAEQPKSIEYRVRRGDTLSEIAGRHGVGVSDLRRWNNLRSNTIRVGQRLTIHSSSSRSGGTISYRVQRGDSLYVIARKYGVTIDDIKRWNSLKSSRIVPGQELKIET